MTIIIVLFLTPILIAYFLNYTYWLRRGIPTPLGYPILGNVLDMFSTTHPPPLKLQEYTKKYGKYYGITEGLSRVLVVSDVEMINEIFLRQFDNFYGRKLNNLQGNPERDECLNVFQSQGYRWKRLRNLSSSSFSSNSLRKMRGIVEDSVFGIIDHLDRISKDEIDMLEIYQEFTMDVIGRIAMGQEGSKLFRNPLLIPVREIFGHNRSLLYTIGNILPPFLAEILRWFMMRYSMLGLSPAVEIHRVIREAVLERIRNPRTTELSEEPRDFIDLFLDAKTDVRSESSLEFSRTSASEVKIEKNLTFEEIIAQCFIFLVAGFDTASLALGYTSYLLALNPEAMRKAQKEIEEVCGEEQSISFDQLSRLKYLEAVIKETLRLYPLGSLGNGRRCMKSTEVCGIRIEKDTNILVDTWSLHYDKQIWGEDSNEFRPERWNDQQMKNGANYLPFGFGPRQCIGMRLAMTEEKLILAHILRKFDFEIGSKTQIPLKLVGRATTQPETLILKLRKRDY
ncbi:unnamed protein product [Caenorhabditis angaria]|uniref:Cytochrome P450 n=1 Tax=Caenorhabditis angaria TaxID=860376 RepID=A0A9P1I8N2_9PELO|nr:unnamed protein product [Caenorhabditis angaria]